MIVIVGSRNVCAVTVFQLDLKAMTLNSCIVYRIEICDAPISDPLCRSGKRKTKEKENENTGQKIHLPSIPELLYSDTLSFGNLGERKMTGALHFSNIQ